MSLWHNVKTEPPTEGEPVIGLSTFGKSNTADWITDIVYYCDHMFYKLSLDPTLGILRKEHIPDIVDYWTECISPELNIS